MTWPRPFTRSARRTTHVLALAPLLAFLALATHAAAAPRAGVFFLPDIQNPEPPIVHAGHGAAPRGMEGWGHSVIDIQSASDASGSFTFRLRPIAGDEVTGTGPLAPLAATRLDLQDIATAPPSFYHGRLETTVPVGVIVRASWTAGGAAAFEAPEPSTDVVLPIVLRDIATHTTLFYIQNTVPVGGTPEYNQLDYHFPDSVTGEELLTFSQQMRPGETGYEDASFMPLLDRLPKRPGGGYIGPLWLHADDGLAALEYGEDTDGTASSATTARPVSAAAALQYLPWVRSGDGNGSLLGIASVADTSADVTVRYLTRTSGQEAARQSFTIAPHGAAYLDLGHRGLGNVAPSGSLGKAFDGSVVVEASQPILAALLDQDGLESASAGAAYNAFGPADLAKRVAAPSLAVSGKPSELLVQNGDAGPVEVTITFRDAIGNVVGSTTKTVAPGARITTTALEAAVPPAVGVVSARVEATGSVAVLVREWDLDLGADVAVSAGVPLVTPSGITPTSTPTGVTATGTPSTTPSPTTSGTLPPPSETPDDALEHHVFLPWSSAAPAAP